MYTVLLIFQVLLGVGIIVLVLLQHGKGADAGAAFGSGASATVFGAQGSANFLSRTTAVLATLFFVNSIALSNKYVIGTPQATTSVVEQVQPLEAPTVPTEGEGTPADVPEEAAPPAEQGGETADLPPVAPPKEAGDAAGSEKAGTDSGAEGAGEAVTAPDAAGEAPDAQTPQ